jgi:hypothetical protein
MKKTVFVLILLSVLALQPISAIADNLALGKQVTGSDYFNRLDNGDVFPFANVTDGRYGDSGTPWNWSYWIGADYQTTGWVTIDLGTQYQVQAFRVQDTHNGIHGDRGTNAFRILLSTDNLSFNEVVTSFFTTSDWSNLTFKEYNIPSTSARYVKFIGDSSYGPVWRSVGINELEVYDHPVPIPASVFLLGSGLLSLGALGWRRKQC